jgi:hypothetical protein
MILSTWVSKAANYFIFIIAACYSGIGFSLRTDVSKNIQICINSPKIQDERSGELRLLAAEDQKDRENWENISEEQLGLIMQRDLHRRMRVGEIFGEGCFKMPEDYMNAALIYQHGDTSDHFYQAFIWSKRAYELGSTSAQAFSALAIDRYLVSIGMKQLFGSQYFKLNQDACLCMQPVEPSFPNSTRKNYSGRTLEDNYKIMSSFNSADCPNVECTNELQSTPEGSIIGFW